MRWRWAMCAGLLLCRSALGQQHPGIAVYPSQFEIGRHTFFDFGPPTDYYELFLVRSGPNGTLVERITLTPAIDSCSLPAKVETVSGSLDQSVEALLGATNPCNIPEKELRREQKRCKKCLVFSGAKVTLQVQCGSQNRLIRSDILDRDMFDPAARTPEHSSRTMSLLSQLDKATSPGVMEKPMFTTDQNSAVSSAHVDPMALQTLGAGGFDLLFAGAPDKASDLYRAAQEKPPSPTIRLVSSAPFAPLEFVSPRYPVLARAAHVEGAVSFKMGVDPEGHGRDFNLGSGNPLLWGAVKQAAELWGFPKEAIGAQIETTIEFRLNCLTSTR
jgi:hypothetical protein